MNWSFAENPFIFYKLELRFFISQKMLQDLIKDLQSSLKSYSQGLANKNMLVDIPWTMVDGDLNLQRLIFRKDNSLYIVKEGEIQESKWEYLAAMNSLVIEVGGKKILMNEVFADGKALILKKDGVGNEFLSFANQNEIHDLNLLAYFENFELKIKEIEENSRSEAESSEGNYLGIFLLITVIVMMLISLFS
ncbi:hypothetical protein [Algoriphagus confluentis]|uniref:Uncharacterized protein n=1 Tax=Algoriphagus confluentis TaxID=1697556 RepID=A0ABQ6PS26_9BACT|nr:hypothetical protein Aconfl_34370 [Algoriphagus confluentis]